MPIGPFGEILGTTGTLETLGASAPQYKSKVIAPRNPKLLKGEQPEFKMKPSQFIFQMSMNTEQKLANMHTMKVPKKVALLDMADTTYQKSSLVNIDEPMFQPFPSEVYFQKFQPFETYEVPFLLRNNDKVPRLVKLTHEESPYFKVISPHNVGQKVGPGLPTTFKIQFTPEEKKDYYHELVCITEREKFVVPIKAIGARAILDFPDEINFPPSPVKHQTSKVLLIRNIGDQDAKYSISTQKPFSVTPENGTLGVNDSVQITVEFTPTTVGDHAGELLLQYDTGEDLYINVYGAAQDANVRLDKNSIRIENTFISMANQRTVTIHNRSDVIAHYRWTQYATQDEEDQQKLMFCETLHGEEDTERDRFLEECIQDPSLRDKMAVLTRTFQNRRKLVNTDNMVFNDDIFHIEPMEGDIWPNSTTEINVIFKPVEAQQYTSVAFCDVTGRESRLPLRLRGDGIGPKVQFSFDNLDMGNIFINSSHTYEVVLANKGDIDAIFTHIPTNTLFGPKFNFNPSEGILMPDGHQAIKISFNSNLLGDFQEDFYFQIDGSPEKLKLSIRGSVIGPTFHFDVPKLKFGNVSYGFMATQICTLHNTALVPMTYTLHVPGDGVTPAINALSDMDGNPSVTGPPSSRPLPPREFTIIPSSGKVPPQSQVKVEVQLCSNTIKKYDLSMVVDVEGVGDEILSLPISAKCIVPQINVLTPILDYGRCFLCHPYEHNIKLQNETDLPAKFEILPQDFNDLTPILHSSPCMKGLLEPHSICDIPLVITPQALEELEVLAQLRIFGSPDPALSIQVTCIGEGPVVHITPIHLDWGQIPVLTEYSQTLFMSNESLIPAKFTAHMVRTNSVWKVEPSSGEIAPEHQMELTVTACLDDSLRFQDKVQINIINSPSRNIPVSGYGLGSTIVINPPMSPSLNLGPHFSRKPCIRRFMLTNRGRRHQSLIWSTEGPPSFKKPNLRRSGTLAPLNASRDSKGKDHLAVEEDSGPVFKLTPHRMELNPGESIEVQLEGQVDTPQPVKEKMLCHAIIGKAGGKELIMKVAISCDFISPLLEVSDSHLSFTVYKTVEDELTVQSKPLTLTNVSQLPLTAILDLNQPFAVVDPDDGQNKNRTEVELGMGESREITVLFDPAYKEDCHGRAVEDVLQITYKEHPHMDEVQLKGEVHFPNLEFEKTEVDFGCILNDTEVTRYLNITNNSPMEVVYRWSFLIDDEPVVVREKPAIAEEEAYMERAETEVEIPFVEVNIEGASSPALSPARLELSEKEALIMKDKDDDDEPEKTDPEKPVTPDIQLQGEAPMADKEGTVLENTSLADHLSPDSRGSTPRRVLSPAVNPNLAALLEKDRTALALGVEEVFDILPLYGSLKPGETEQVTLTFFGHSHIMSRAKAICEVDGGPTYEITLKGQASLMQYEFDCLHIDYGKQNYDQAASAEIVLMNTGKVGFEFTGLGVDPGLSPKPKPGIPIMVPYTGFIEANSRQVIRVKFLPGVPQKFQQSFQIQVAHFEPNTVNLYGEGVFPRISLDLPRVGENNYDELVTRAKEALVEERKAMQRPTTAASAMPDSAVDTHCNDAAPSELELQMEIERLVVEEFSLSQQREHSQPDVLCVHATNRATPASTKKKKTPKPKPVLPEYLLDLGHVVLGTVKSHVVRVTNTGWFPVSFIVQKEHLIHHGIHVELDRVKQLPGAPDHESVDFQITFDPRGANLGLETMETLIPINVIGGPMVAIRVRGNVTMPDMEISTDILEFGDVRCGDCQVITVQLYNHGQVKCDWNSLPSDKDLQRKGDKYIPMHLRRKSKLEKLKPKIFEMMPPTGSLLPGQRVNVQVKFMPVEEKYYENKLLVRLAQSSQRILLMCKGQGLEPQLELDSHLVEFGPVLPHSNGHEKEIVIRNPCRFPIEIYNLEFDKTYLEEEKILRLMKGYDEYNTLLLPPREPGDKLPQELMDYYEEQLKKFEEMETARRQAEVAAEQEAAEERGLEDGEEEPPEISTEPRASEEELVKAAEQETQDKSHSCTTKKSEGGVGDLEITPVSAAIARHLGIDLSPEGKAARNRRGIAVIVHGAPRSGKSTAAVQLAKRYEAALLTLDGVVTEAISNCNTPAGKRARELCAEAAKKKAEELEAARPEDGTAKAPGLSVEALTAHTQGNVTIGQVMAAHSVAQSLASNRKSMMSEMKGKDKHGSIIGGKAGPAGSSGADSQVPGSPPPMGPVPRRLSISASEAGEDGLISTVLPEDLLVDILSDRMMLSDCQRGVVFDGLDTLFSFSQLTAARTILKAFNNRKYIYFVTMKLDYTSLKQHDKKLEEEKELARKLEEEAERQRFEEMDEEEYDNLPEDLKAMIDKKRLEAKKERLRRENEEKERERERKEKEAQEAELRRMEEESSKKKNKKKGGEEKGTPAKDSKKSVIAGIKSQDSKTQLKSQEGKKNLDGEVVGKSASGTERPESHGTERGESANEQDNKKKKDKSGKDGKRTVMVEMKQDSPEDSPPVNEEELLLQLRFKTFEHLYPNIMELIDRWDRSILCVRPTTPPDGHMDSQEDQSVPQSGKKGRKAPPTPHHREHDKKDSRNQKEAVKEESLKVPDKQGDMSEGDADTSQDPSLTDEERREKRLEDGIGIPHILVDCVPAMLEPKNSVDPVQQVLAAPRLPSVEEVLDGLGMGAHGPPVPPPANFSVIPYPVKRQAPPGAEQGHYSFIATSPDDPNVGGDDKATEPDEDQSQTADSKVQEEPLPKSGGKSKDKKEKRRSSPKIRTGARRGSGHSSPPPGASTPASEADGSLAAEGLAEQKAIKLSIFRWVVPAEGEITIRLKFQSDELGQYDQTLNFEIVGTRRRYQLYCRGICAFPTISREPRIVFPNRKKTKTEDEIVHKKYILTSETFEFGPLLVGKSRDKYKEGKYPENMEKLKILNTSPMETEITFCFLTDSKGETYLLDPPNMTLKPGEHQELSIWAYPKTTGTYEDSLVCCVKENPEPILFKLLCHGVRPELELDKKALHFDKVLLHRKDTKTLFLRNSTLLPVAWHLNGLDNLGDDFSVSQESGTIDPKSEFGLNFYFRAIKPVTTNKKSIRLEVMDVGNIMGLVQSENIAIHAEAYDVALDLSFAKGADAGSIDFEVIRVGEEAKVQCSLKNKGKYEIEYSFVLEPTEGCPKEVCDMCTVTPNHGTLGPIDRPQQVQVIFKANREVVVKDQPILRCQVIEPNMGDGETIASIPIKVCVKAVFSKYNIFPINDINFGPMMVNSKKIKTFTIENKGENFDFKYTITKLIHAAQSVLQTKGKGRGVEKRSKSRDGLSSGRSVARPKRTESIRQEVATGAQQKLILGAFSISPAYGFIVPGGHATITVECNTEISGVFDEVIAIDITGRDPTQHPSGVPYRLVAEGCIPAINIIDIGAIMEEHRIVKNLATYQINLQGPQAEAGGMYGEEENRFVFNNVLVGAKTQARFKITNVSKIPCDVLFAMKPTNSKHAKFQDVFEVEPSRAQIPNHSYIYATVTFLPSAMQQFAAIFEAAIEVSMPNQAKGRNLTFEVTGEGNLPRISIMKPAVRNKKGQPLLLFQRSLVGRTQTLPLVINNDGNLPSKVDIDMADPDGVFRVSPTGETQAVIAEMDIDADGRKRPHAASVIINVGKVATFDVAFTPRAIQRSQAHVRLTVLNNQYEDSVIQLIGEGFEDYVTLDNIHSIPQQVDPEAEEGAMADDNIPAAKANHINFGDCFINEPRTLTFSMCNHSQTDTLRFQWKEDARLKFSPSVGHLRPNSKKDFQVTFKADAPHKMVETAVLCRIIRITYPQKKEVPDWDDRLRTVKWVDAAPPPAPPSETPAPTGPPGKQDRQDKHDKDRQDKQQEKPGSPQLPPDSETSVRPLKKKVIETEPEPPFQEVPDSSRNLELLVSIIADYCKIKCRTEAIHFRDTLMFQTRVFEFPLSNKGTIALDYNWQVVMDNFVSPGPRSVTFAAGEGETSRPGTANALAVRNSGVRPDSAVSSVVTDTAYVPFTVQPESGTILPGKKASIFVKFSPLDVQDYDARLICSILNLEKGKQGPVVGVKGRSLMPYCHFELSDSDYITAARRNPELQGPGGAPPGTTLDSNTRVIELESVGIGVRNSRRFNVINPTNQRYTYKWFNEDEINPKHLSDFTCINPEGEIRPGKKCEMGFDFLSSALGLVESFWRFQIPDLNISVPFLLVGNTTDPHVNLDRSHLNFKSLLIGHRAVQEIQLINNEDTAFSFAFKESSLISPGFTSTLQVEPMSGSIPPKSKMPINVYFMPLSDKEVNFNVVCEVKRKTLPLTLNVKAEGYSMNCLLICQDSAGNKVDLTDSGVNEINFGEVETNETAVRNLYIVNSGKFNFDFSWEFSDRQKMGDMLSVTPQYGAVPFGDRVQCQLMFCPPSRTSLRGKELTLKISNGPTYLIRLTGHGFPPGLHFSFNSYNFGPSFIIKGGMAESMVKSVQLLLTNRDHKEISVDCLYQPTPHLHHDFSVQVIAPGQSVPVTFRFYPREVVKYHEVLTFEINGLSKQSLEIFGEGTEMKVEVADPKNKIVKLGALRIGQSVKRSIPVVNNSPAPVTFTIAMTPSCDLLNDPNVLKITPTKQEITLPAKTGTSKVDIVFSPKCRIPAFTEEVTMECAGMSQPLFVVTGCCQGIEINLDTDSIPFGSVVQKSSSTRRLIMSNTGDIGAKFKWDIKKFEPAFSISPVEGYIAAGMEVPFEVVFHPQEPSHDIRYDNLKCTIEGGKPLKLTLTGMCNTQPSMKEVVHFSTLVRQKETRNLMVANRTNMLWKLRPIIDGEYWSGSETFTVEPQQNKGYELTYHPLAMTSEGRRHNGTVFFPLPDGGGLMYMLTGAAESPKPNGKITQDIPCKTPYTEMLKVHNWLKKPQRFRVRVEMIRPERLDPGTTIKFLDYVDVPGNSQRNYKMTFFAHKEGISQFKLIFMNESSCEYQYYELTMRAIRPGIISVINLVTPVRRVTSHTVTLENPLSYPVTFNATCNVPEVLMPAQLQVPAQSEGQINLDYLPLKVGDGQGRLEFTCNDLGLYLYDLNLKATPAGTERALYFKAALGSTNTLVARFTNFAKQKTDYTCKIDNADFHVDKSVPAAPAASPSGTEVAVEVNYEPSSIGETRATLTLSSGLGGDYTFPLFGTCIPPKPQGPFVIRAGTTAPITFRNVFSHSTAFVFQVDNPLFHIAKQGETIRSKKEHRITVGFDGNDSTSKAAVMGKLTVSCAKSAGGTTNTQWVYYLKGITPDSK